MATGLNYIIFNTGAGWLGISGSPGGLLHVTLPQPSAQNARQILGDSAARSAWAPDVFQDLIKRLRTYFDGHRANFQDRLDLSQATAFQRQVWETARLIPFGETRSYTWVAEQIGKPGAARAVGQALGRNPLPIIVPCHRVLAGDGTLGGFSGGIEIKKYLLNLEKAAGTG